MKKDAPVNYVPVVLAVLMGFAAVLAVSRMLNTANPPPEEKVSVLVASRDLKAGETLSKDALRSKPIAKSARPANAIDLVDQGRAIGQVIKAPVAQGDYVLSTSINIVRSLSGLVGKGEWAVTIPGGGAGIGKMVQRGDEVAVIGTFNLEMSKPNLNPAQAAQKVSKQVTLVLFPRVRVVDTLSGGRNEEAGDVVLALPPQEAQVLIAAEGRIKLTLALRQQGDEAAIARSATGMVDEETWEKLLEGVKPVLVPDIPAEKH